MAEQKNWELIIKQAEKMRANGMSYKKIADEFGLGESTLYYHLAKNREDNPKEPRKAVVKEGNTKTPKPKQKPVIDASDTSNEEFSNVPVFKAKLEGNKELRELNEQLMEKNKQLQEQLEVSELRLSSTTETYHQLVDDYEHLKTEFSAMLDEKWELQNQIKRLIAEQEELKAQAERERADRIAYQGKVQAYAVALKAAL